MTYKENIKAILECYFTGFKEEIIDSACNRILEQQPKIDTWSIKDVADTLMKHGLIAEQEPCEDAISLTKEAYSDLCLRASKADDLQRALDMEKGAYNASVKNIQCEDAISRQAVLDAIDAAAWAFCDYLIRNGRNDEQKPISLFVDNLREYVREELPPVIPQRTGHWIPVSERLPEYGVAVLTYDGSCYVVEKRIPTIIDDNGEPISSEWWVSDDYDESNSEYYPNLRDGACIAWMPLPEPYEPQESEG